MIINCKCKTDEIITNYCPNCGTRQSAVLEIGPGDVSAPILPCMPGEYGEAFAKKAIAIWEMGEQFIEIDLREAQAELIISNFYTGFISYIKSNRPEFVSYIPNNIIWIHKFQFETEAAERSIKMALKYKPSIEEVYDELGYFSTWNDNYESTEDEAGYITYITCSCGCEACHGTGTWWAGNAGLDCCGRCPVHYDKTS